MKTSTSRFPFALAAACLSVALFTGCKTGGGGGASSGAPGEVSDDYTPQMGMTKQEVKVEYGGEPDSVSTQASGGEVWRYHTNAGEQWIPFNFGYSPRYDLITFDAAGLVVDFSTER